MNRFLSTRTHAIIGYTTAVLLLLAPNIFGFSDNGGAAVTIPRIMGVVLIMSELMSNNGLSLAKIIPMKAHLMMDVVAGIFLAISPWLFSFHDQGANAWAPLLVAGLMYIGVSMVTQTQPSEDRSRRAVA